MARRESPTVRSSHSSSGAGSGAGTGRFTAGGLRGPLVGPLIGISLLLALPACGPSMKEYTAVKGQLDALRSEHEALKSRVFEVEARTAAVPASPSSMGQVTGTGQPGATASEEKPLKVVKLEPVAKPPVVLTPEPDDDEPRPMLKIGPSGTVEQTLPDEKSKGNKSIKSKSPIFDPQAAKDYDAAYAFIKAKKPKEALDAFGGFIVRYPEHPYAGNALFWRGECYYALGDFMSAIGQYDAMVVRYPGSPKLADALLKTGLSHKKLGSFTKSREAFARLRKEFPTSEAAKKIPPEDAS